MVITCDLFGKWVAGIRKELRAGNFDESTLSDDECSFIWAGWSRRVVKPAPRKIFKAKTFTCPVVYQVGLQKLEKAFEGGAEIWPWQSKLIDKIPYEDGMFNDFGALHFHLGVTVENDGYVSRTGDLLYAIVTSDTIYEIGIYSHRDWHELEILHVIDDNWPHLLAPVTIPGTALSFNLQTRDQVKKMRDAHINTFIQLKSGRIVAPPGGGVASSGDSIQAVRQVMNFKRHLIKASKEIKIEIEALVSQNIIPNHDYDVELNIAQHEISASIAGAKWTIWRA